jgi:hypothetical protein
VSVATIVAQVRDWFAVHTQPHEFIIEERHEAFETVRHRHLVLDHQNSVEKGLSV